MESLMKKCSNCGESIPDDAFKCPYCGAVNPKGEKGRKLKITYESTWHAMLRAIRPQVSLLFMAAIFSFISVFPIWVMGGHFLAAFFLAASILLAIVGCSSYFL